MADLGELVGTDEQEDITQESMSGLAGYIKGKYKESEDGRLSDEQRWLKAYKNYRGTSEDSEDYRKSERSKVTVKITKVKVLAAFGQLVDILFSQGKVPISVESTPMPEGVEEFVHLETPLDQQLEQSDPYGYEGDGRELPAGATEATELELGPYEDDMAQANLAAGPSNMGEPQLSPAKEAARKMEKLIHDQLLDASAVSELRKGLFEQCLLGTGIVKGPFNHTKTIHKWSSDDEGRFYDPEEKVVPRLSHVSCWDLYPDPSALSLEDAEYIIERHRMNRSQLRALRNRPFFDVDAIEACLTMGSSYEERYFENDLYADNDPIYNEDRFEVLEYWGVLDAAMAEEIQLDLPKNTSPLDQVQVNAWICGNQILRVVLNPFVPERLPYQVFPYEKNPYRFFGIGVPENMEDAQLLMNGHVRMAIDNLALAGNLIFEVDENMMVPGQSMDIYPGKIFRRQSGAPGTGITGIKFPSTAVENLQMYDKARQLADEETGIPSIVHGQTGVTGTGRTAAGLSMLMGSAGLGIKTVIKNIDDHLLRPLGENMFMWNMQFSEDEDATMGDLEIKPKGTTSVMMKEVRSQRLTMLLQTVSNPMLAPFVKLPTLIKELAIAQDMEPDELVNDVNEAQIFAEILRGLNGQTTGEEAIAPGEQQPNMGAPEGVPAGADPTDPTGVGGGTIGTGTTPTAGEGGFTGNVTPITGQGEGGI
tara:strand:- start:5154 stop:7271 length:2118 start_codon:yes stop_codon:yes gene_type:complete